jgi:lysophospholipase L1-like esterase
MRFRMRRSYLQLVLCFLGSLCLVGPAASLAAPLPCPPPPPGSAAPKLPPQPPPGDVAWLCRYQPADTARRNGTPPINVVMMGDSITELWGRTNPALFGGGIVNRGIGGQTTWQMLLRFRQDVIDLHPRAVLILGGTNDLNGPPVLAQPAAIEANIASMADLATANQIAVILATIPPMRAFLATPERAAILDTNSWIIAYARRNHYGLADFYAVLVDRTGALDPQRSVDFLHPNDRGYLGMESVLGMAVANALR